VEQETRSDSSPSLDHWHEQRRKGIGGSDAPVVCGQSRFKSRLQLYYEKRGEVAFERAESEAIYWGKKLEDFIARRWAELNNRKIKKAKLRTSQSFPFMLGNCDRQILGDPRGSGILECKNFDGFFYRNVRQEIPESLPDDVYIQGQHYCVVFDAQFVSFAILIGGNRFCMFDVEKDPDFCETLVQVEEEFFSCIQSATPPEPTNPKLTDLLKALYPKDNGEVLTVSDSYYTSAAKTLYRDDQMTKLGAKAVDYAKCQFKLAMKEAQELKIPGFGKATWKSTKDRKFKALDIERVKLEYPEVYKACMKEVTIPGHRTFRLTPDKDVKAELSIVGPEEDEE
jgi:putative phage-type endonuclease